jgi:uncharacterized protein YodC (DUF2158 family)
MSTSFKVGDVVRLKSGGEKMTVGQLEKDVNSGAPDKFVFCSWFVGKKLQQKTFPVEMLELVIGV